MESLALDILGRELVLPSLDCLIACLREGKSWGRGIDEQYLLCEARTLPS